MPSVQNILYSDQGVNWVVSFEYSADNGVSIPWTFFEMNVPRDLDDISQDELEPTMLFLAQAVARGQGHDV